MGVKSIVYKLNSENFKEFKIDNSNNSETLFIIRDSDNIEVKEILRLLKNNRKILISDHSIIDCEKIFFGVYTRGSRKYSALFTLSNGKSLQRRNERVSKVFKRSLFKNMIS